MCEMISGFIESIFHIMLYSKGQMVQNCTQLQRARSYQLIH